MAIRMMSPVRIVTATRRHEGTIQVGRADPSYRAFELLYLCFLATPLAAGFGKLFGFLADWERYVSPFLSDMAGGNVRALVNGIGLAEIALGVFVAAAPRAGGWAAAVWLWLGAVNMMLTRPIHDGLAACFVALSLGAIALSCLAREFEPIEEGSPRRYAVHRGLP